MKIAWRTIVFSFVVFVGAGCATHQPALPESSALSLEVVPQNSSVTISQSDVYRVGEGFVIAGKIRRPHKIQLPGHMDLNICSVDGTSLVQTTAPVIGLRSNRRGVLELPFRFRLDQAPPEGARIRLKYHAPPFEDDRHNICL